MASRFWVGGTESWNGTIGLKWALTSGGLGGQAAPTAADDVFLDANSGTVTVTVDTTKALCRSFNATGFTGTFHLTEIATVMEVGDGTTGHFTLGSGMTFTVAGGAEYVLLKFLSTTTGNNITSNGKTIPVSVQFVGTGGVWTLQDAFTCTGNAAAGSIDVEDGELITNGMTVTVLALKVLSSATAILTPGASTFNLTSTGTVWNMGANGVFTAPNTSTINITDISASNKTFAGGGETYGTLGISGGGAGIVIIQGSNTFANLPQITGGTKNLRFTAGTTQTFTGGTSFGNGANLLTIDTQTGGSAATLSKASGTVECTSISLKDSTAAGGALWYAGPTPPSVDVSGNSGWVFSAVPLPSSGNGVQQNALLLGVG